MLQKYLFHLFNADIKQRIPDRNALCELPAYLTPLIASVPVGGQTQFKTRSKTYRNNCFLRIIMRRSELRTDSTLVTGSITCDLKWKFVSPSSQVCTGALRGPWQLTFLLSKCPSLSVAQGILCSHRNLISHLCLATYQMGDLGIAQPQFPYLQTQKTIIPHRVGIMIK